MTSKARRVRRIDGLVLAGGRSRRFGSDKRIALFDGDELVRLATRKLARCAIRV